MNQMYLKTSGFCQSFFPQFKPILKTLFNSIKTKQEQINNQCLYQLQKTGANRSYLKIPLWKSRSHFWSYLSFCQLSIKDWIEKKSVTQENLQRIKIFWWGNCPSLPRWWPADDSDQHYSCRIHSATKYKDYSAPNQRFVSMKVLKNDKNSSIIHRRTSVNQFQPLRIHLPKNQTQIFRCRNSEAID